ncbi:ribonuclease H2 subunit B-like isoform X2 [Pecten maximus]|uniref:ribonuclease H2 subunit B-like isoform X1 n=1 Tax=Pecten maximus TaxID=6579 RepID=UPI0014581602|nr:ribonuclease H2 subunit B-like isoform X1 [Pecten maximus]XP_033760101.1 ribonuclease H2 subunit B-like isoform X2 [Pecten maximus]
MSTRRSSRQTSKDSNGDMTHEHKNGGGNHDVEQWVFLINDSIIEENPNAEDKPTFCKLRHPKSDKGALFVFSHNERDIHEVTSFKEEFRSWFIGNQVQSDGSLILTAIVDPVFLVLPYLIKAEKTGKFMTIDQIVTDDDFPECHHLYKTAGMSELYQVSDMKGDDDLRVYRFNKERTLSWLQGKIDKLADVLSSKNICVSGAQSSSFIRSKRFSTATTDDYRRFAHGMVCDYLSVELGQELLVHLGLPAEAEKTEATEPPAKRMKTENSGPTEDYSQGKNNVKVKAVKMNKAQSLLSKVDKSGMKSMSSFFSPKAKT